MLRKLVVIACLRRGSAFAAPSLTWLGSWSGVLSILQVLLLIGVCLSVIMDERRTQVTERARTRTLLSNVRTQEVEMDLFDHDHRFSA